MAKRKAITKDEKLAAALLEVQRLRGDPIPREQALLLTAGQICSLFHFDHAAGFVAHGADNHPAGLTPLVIPAHWEKTRKVDQPAIAKCNRIEKETAAFRARMTAMKTGDPVPKWAMPKRSSWGTRPMNGKGAKLRSRNTFQKAERP